MVFALLTTINSFVGRDLQRIGSISMVNQDIMHFHIPGFTKRIAQEKLVRYFADSCQETASLLKKEISRATEALSTLDDLSKLQHRLDTLIQEHAIKVIGVRNKVVSLTPTKGKVLRHNSYEH